MTDLDKDSRAAVLKALLSRNPAEKAHLYVDAFMEYREAQANIQKNGAIVADPRTGAAIQNPYLVVAERAFVRLEKLHLAGVNATAVWK